MKIQNEYHGYSLTEYIKQHEYGSVYRGQASEGAGTDFVIKIFTTQLLSIRERQRFLQEANFLTSLRHPALLPLLEAGIDKGQPYLVREYAPDGSLISQLSHQESGTFPISTVMAILTRISAAITYLHQKQISHGAIKPENILFDANKQAFLADIHPASIYPDPLSPLQKPLSTASLEFQEEQRKTQDDKKDEIQADLYAFSSIAYELLTGHQPFPSADEQGKAPVPPSQWISSLSQQVDQVLAQALSPSSEERFSSATLFVEALQRALTVSGSGKGDSSFAKQPPPTLSQPIIERRPVVSLQLQARSQQLPPTRSIERWRAFTLSLFSIISSSASLLRSAILGRSQTPSHQFLVKRQNSTFFIRPPIQTLRHRFLVNRQTGTFFIQPPIIFLILLLVLASLLIPFALSRFSSSPTSTHVARTQVPAIRTTSVATGHVALKVPSVTQHKPTPQPTPQPTPTPVPTKMPEPALPPPPVLVNAGFEFPSLHNNFEYAPDDAGWTFTQDSGIAGNGSDLTVNTSNAPWGVQVAFIQARGAISQNVSFVQGTYRISFLAAQRIDSSSTQSLLVLIDNTVIGSFSPVGRNYLYYTTASFTVSPGVHTLQFKGLKGGAHNTVFIDSVTVIY